MKKKLVIVIGIIFSLVIAWYMGVTPSQKVVYTPAQIEDQKIQEEQDKKVQAQETKEKDLEEQQEYKEEIKSQEVLQETKVDDLAISDSQTSTPVIDNVEPNQEIQEPKDKVDTTKKTDAKDTSNGSGIVEVTDEALDTAQSDKKKADAIKEEIIAEQEYTKKDKYMTDPVPEGKPKPVEPQDVKVNKEAAFKVKLSISCGTILNNMKLLDKNKIELVPEDGIIFPLQEVTAYEGESVFDVLLREVQINKIHMEFINTPMYNSAYIEGIHNLYEFDAGELSGWMYKVNEWFPNYGCSRYQVKEGDVIEWVYTCDLGRDVGDFYYNKK